MDTEKKYIANVDKLIPRPEIALDVLKIVHDLDGDTTELAQKIEQDPNLTANMLRMANSAYFGHTREISSVKDIIIRLGYDMVKMLAITSASAGLLTSPQEAYNLEPRVLWNHSRACAVFSAIIAKYADSENIYSVYTAALLHDIGKVLLNRPLQSKSDKRKIDKKFSTIVELERFLLQTDHARVGMALLKQWGLPDNIFIPVGYHHSTEEKETSLLNSKIVYLANFLLENIDMQSTKQEKYCLKVEEFLEQNHALPHVPNFQANMATIIEEFFIQYNGIVLC